MPKSAWAIAAGLMVLTFLAFLPVLHCGFTDFDDPWYISNNRHVQGGLTVANIHWALTDTAIGYWQPLSWLSLMLDTTLFGTGPAGYHRTNLVLHALSAGVAFLVLCRLTGSAWRAALVAAIYAVHPLRVESVAWAAERKDVLSNLMAWLTIGGYIAYVKAPGSKRYLLVLTPFVLGLLAKPMIVTLPCLLLLLDYWPLERRDRTLKQLIVEKAPLFLLAFVAGISAFRSQRQCGAIISLAQYPLLPRLGNIVVGYGLYLWKMVWFANLAAFYPIPIGWTLMHVVQLIGGGVAILLISIIAIVQRKNRPWLLVGWLWFLGVLAPVCGISQSGPQLLADRFSYLPSVGLLIMLIWSIPKPKGLTSLRVHIAAAAATLVILGTATWSQAGYWRDTGTLFESALYFTHDNWLAHDQIGLVLYRNGRVDEAIAQCRRSLALNPYDPVANLNLGIALASKQKEREAIPFLQAALRVRPDSAESHTMLGVCLQHIGQLQKAFAEYRLAVQLQPDYAPAHSDVGGLLAQIGMTQEAITELHIAQSLAPDDRQIQLKLKAAVAMLPKSSLSGPAMLSPQAASDPRGE